MSTHNICFHGETRKISCGYPLLSVAMPLDSFRKWGDHIFYLVFYYPTLNLILLYFPFHFKNLDTVIIV